MTEPLTSREALATILFPRWWVTRARDQLMAMRLPTGPLGDWVFLFREQLNDALNRPDDTDVAQIPTVDAIRRALFKPEESDAYDNLDGALIDIERLSEQGKPTDAVCIRTIRRVLTQLNAVHNILAASPVSSTDQREGGK